MEFSWTEEQTRFRREVRELVEATVPDDWYMTGRQGDEEHAAISQQLVPILIERGWMTPHWPREWGGEEDWWKFVILGEESWSRGEPRSSQYMNVNWIAPVLFAAGTPEQQEYHLRRIREGNVFWCQGFSEPDAGSDLASLQCRAVREGDEYVINGTKVWTSYADLAEFCFLLVRTGDKDSRHDGITILLVPMDTSGVTVRDIPALGGVPHLIHELHFEDVRVPVTARLGNENEGWAIVRDALSYERTGLPRGHSAGHVVDRVAAWARENDSLDARSLESLGEARALAEAGISLAYSVIDERQRNQPPSAQANINRVAAVQAELGAADAGLEVMGPAGVVAGSLGDTQIFNAITAATAAGAYDIQLNLIARSLRGSRPSGRSPR